MLELERNAFTVKNFVSKTKENYSEYEIVSISVIAINFVVDGVLWLWECDANFEDKMVMDINANSFSKKKKN